MDKTKKLKIEWVQLIFCTIWFLGAALVLAGYYGGFLDESFSVPRVIAWLYDLAGVPIASAVQLIITALGIFFSFKRVPVETKVEADPE
ncbi:hypothetical protein Q2T76_07365 [Lactobacillus sp. YT155]|uniref:hypothetical protein n=1 Tax=Lactobacillus sp. YT155 TaxID=3060955 RepID=UPI00265E1F73|nr:hypothetical protein [Lactobacillus sp. YT155]MDO1605878.1 hypothetical protein [Lactobacillus sp. YT155]